MKRAWTVIAEGSIVRRLVGTKHHDGTWDVPPGVPGLSARILSNACCMVYPCEPEEPDKP